MSPVSPVRVSVSSRRADAVAETVATMAEVMAEVGALPDPVCSWVNDDAEEECGADGNVFAVGYAAERGGPTLVCPAHLVAALVPPPGYGTSAAVAHVWAVADVKAPRP